MSPPLSKTVANFLARDLSDRVRITKALGMDHLLNDELSDFENFKRVILCIRVDDRVDELNALLWPEKEWDASATPKNADTSSAHSLSPSDSPTPETAP